MVFQFTDPPQSGDDVLRIQLRLAYFGFAFGGIDGVFGPGTQRAVGEFQDWCGVPRSGVVDSGLAELMGLPLFGPVEHEGRYRSLGKAFGLSDVSVDFLTYHECGGQARYERSFASPVWPGVNSGVTIGIGFDIGHNDESSFAESWRGRVSDADYARLVAYAGVNAGGMGDDAAAEFFQDAIRDLADVEIPWSVAIDVFADVTLRRYVDLTRGAFEGFGSLSPSCRGALVSLVYNRGTRMTDTPNGISRQEMRDIRDHLSAGDIATIPDDLRRMADRWPSVPGLQRRRREEAALFEWGLKSGG